MSHLMPHQKSHSRLFDAGLNAVADGGANDVAIGVGLLAFDI